MYLARSSDNAKIAAPPATPNQTTDWAPNASLRETARRRDGETASRRSPRRLAVSLLAVSPSHRTHHQLLADFLDATDASGDRFRVFRVFERRHLAVQEDDAIVRGDADTKVCGE